MKFLEDFHVQSDNLREIGHFTRTEAFKDAYIVKVLAEGLPANFEN